MTKLQKSLQISIWNRLPQNLVQNPKVQGAQDSIMPKTTEVDEAEIAKLVSDGGLKQETLARRRRVRASFQAFTVQH